jgi:Domain of unknown function (DUF397)
MDLTGATWRKSSFSGGSGGSCMEIAFVPGSKEGSDRVIAMRDSGRPDDPVLIFTPGRMGGLHARRAGRRVRPDLSRRRPRPERGRE